MADQGSEGFFSPFLRNQRMTAAIPFIKGRVLDVGCGIGLMANNISYLNYVGVDTDESSLNIARQRNPKHNFLSQMPSSNEKFDTIISLAVIEHVDDPGLFLHDLTVRMDSSEDSSIVITTPNPVFEKIHAIGSKIKMFSQHASEEHKGFLNRKKLFLLANYNGLFIHHYRYFLFFANQLVVYRRIK